MEPGLVVGSTTRHRLEDQEDKLVLAAALAALLVEYGRYTSQPETVEGQGSHTNWRMMGRWEQLQG